MEWRVNCVSFPTLVQNQQAAQCLIGKIGKFS